MPDREALREIGEEARKHAAYLLKGQDKALPDECDLCAELRKAGLLELRQPKYRQPRWEVRSDE